MTNVIDGMGSEERAAALLPEGLAYLLREKPLLWHESEDEYDELLAGIFAEMDPKGVIETILVKDVVDYVWEIRRMKALKIAALHAELPSAIGAVLEPNPNAAIRAMVAQQYKSLVHGAVSGLQLQADALLKEMNAAHVTPQMLQYEALKCGISIMSAIEAAIVRLERRRDQLLKQIPERRQAFKALARTLLEREGAELVEVDQGKPN